MYNHVGIIKYNFNMKKFEKQEIVCTLDFDLLYAYNNTNYNSV